MSLVREDDPKISPGRKRWELDREGWEALMAALAPDSDLAGQKYEELRHRLSDLFAWEGCSLPDQLADEALNRLARKLTEGVVIPHLDRYAFGIARNHAFVDGNKRTGFVVGVLFLELHSLDFVASEEDATQAVLDLASGKIDETVYTSWLRPNSRPRRKG